MSAVEKFPILLSDAEEESSAVPPCFSSEGINVSKMNQRIVAPILMTSSIYTSGTTISTSLP